MKNRHFWLAILGGVFGGLTGAALLIIFLLANPTLARIVLAGAALRVSRSVAAVTAQQFVLVSKRGRTLAILGSESEDSSALRFLGSDGKPIAELSTAERGGLATLTLRSSKGRELFLGVEDPAETGDLGARSGETSLSLLGAGASPLTLQLSLIDEEDSGLELRRLDKNSFIAKPLAALTVSPSSKSSLKLYDESGSIRTAIGSVKLQNSVNGSSEDTEAASLMLSGPTAGSFGENPELSFGGKAKTPGAGPLAWWNGQRKGGCAFYSATAKHARFIGEYVIDYHATYAAIRFKAAEDLRFRIAAMLSPQRIGCALSVASHA